MAANYHPAFQHQGPAEHCIIHGHYVGWLSCTAYSTAMIIDFSTKGEKHPTGCAVRAQTGDVKGGLTIAQAVSAASHWDVHLAKHAGNDPLTPGQVADALQHRRGMIVQGNTSALLSSTFRATLGDVNHCVAAYDGRGWDSRGFPREVLVGDPAADGRDRNYHVDQGPSWWPWATLMRFASALRPRGDNDWRTIGAGHIWAGVGPSIGSAYPTPPDDPVVTLRYGGVKTKPFPDRTRAVDPAGNARVNVRLTPGSGTTRMGAVVDTLAPNELFVAYQKTPTGYKLDGSRTWYGNKTGTRWVHSSGLTHKGGST